MKRRTARRLNAQAYRFLQRYAYRAEGGPWIRVRRLRRSAADCSVISFPGLPRGTRVQVAWEYVDERCRRLHR